MFVAFLGSCRRRVVEIDKSTQKRDLFSPCVVCGGGAVGVFRAERDPSRRARGS